MNVELQKIGPCKVKLLIKAEADETRKEYEDVVKIFEKQGRVPGFRPGKVPRAVILRSFQKGIKEEVTSRLIRTFYKQAVDEQKLKISAIVNVGDVLFTPETGITFTMVCDVKPEFEVPKYTKLPITFEEPAVTDDQIQEQIQHLRKAFAKFEDAGEGYKIVDGDLVCMDFTGTIDGKPIGEVEPKAAPLSAATDFWLQVEEDRFVPEVVDAIKGMSVGEKTEVKAKFPKEHPLPGLAGKKALYTVEIKKIRQCVFPTDEELLKQMKVESMEKLIESRRASMLESAIQAEKQRREQSVIETLLKKTGEFDLPDAEVNEEVRLTLDRILGQAQYRGLTREDLEKNRESIIASATTIAKTQLRSRYVLTAIAEAEKITATEEEQNARIAMYAAQMNKTHEQLKALLEKNGRMDALQEEILTEKAMAFILDSAKAK
ncbi:MAG: trigger factor [Kiritimatiellae bacterium]|nr:trigger factor [Kiritimatiellia bacterium]